MKKIGILGATGLIGAQYITQLRKHPWFKLHALAASDKSIGSFIDEIPLRGIKELTDCDIIFSALPGHLAKEIDTFYARQGIRVISSSSCHRHDPDIPLLIPEINPHHVQILPYQKKMRLWSGEIISKPNCSVQTFLLPLAPLHERFQLKKISVTTFQAVSGAGMGGLASFSILDNVIPFIENEEEKSENEPLKILGTVEENRILPNSSLVISAHCNRVPVLHGHLACVSVSFEQKATREDILEAWKKPMGLDLPSSPKRPVIYLEDNDRPQPRLDRDLENGMSAVVGRLRPCPLFDWRFVCLSHNTIRGGAGGGILSAELLELFHSPINVLN